MSGDFYRNTDYVWHLLQPAVVLHEYYKGYIAAYKQFSTSEQFGQKILPLFTAVSNGEYGTFNWKLSLLHTENSFCIQCSGKINTVHENSHFTLLMFIFIYFNELLQLQSLLKVVEFEQAPGDGGGHASQVCYSPWGHKQSDMTEQLNNNNKAIYQAGCHKLLLEELNTVPMTTGKGQLKTCAWCLLTFVLHTFFHCWF